MSGREFCAPAHSSYPKWGVWDVFKWRVLSEKFGGGRAYLIAYKDAWVVHNKHSIEAAAAGQKIPPILLAAVAHAEVGGMPDGIKKPLFMGRRVTWHTTNARHVVGRKAIPGYTSVGAVSIQMRVAARELGLSLEEMPINDQIAMLNCLTTDVYNLQIVAKHLRSLILHDYPSIDTTKLTDEQFIVAGSRYNRGIERPLADILGSLRAAPGANERSYSEYGRTMIKHRDHVSALLRKL